MEFINGQVLLEEIKNTDLEFMQQSDLVECLDDIINKQLKRIQNKSINKEDIIKYLIDIGISKEEFEEIYDKLIREKGL